MKKTLLAVALAAAALAATGTASAAKYRGNTLNHGHWYVLGAVGGSYLDSKAKDLADVSYSDNGDYVSVKKNETSIAGKVGLGYQIIDYLAVEGGVYYLGKPDFKVTEKEGDTVSHSKVKVTSYMLAVDAVGLLPVYKADFFVKGGFGVVRTKASVSGGVSDDFDGSVSQTKIRIAPKIGGGVQWHLNRKLDLRAEYEGIFNATKKEDAIGKTDYHLFTLGLKYKF